MDWYNDLEFPTDAVLLAAPLDRAGARRTHGRRRALRRAEDLILRAMASTPIADEQILDRFAREERVKPDRLLTMRAHHSDETDAP